MQVLKKVFVALFISFSSFCFSQPTVLTPSLLHDTCLHKKFSIVFYIVLDSNYSVVTATQPTLNMIIDTLNSRFNHICVTFENCSTVFIPNYPFNKWKKNITDPVVTANWYTDSTINFYIVDSIKPSLGGNNSEVGGYTYDPPPTPPLPPKNVIVIEQNKMLMQNFQVLFHTMGHFFGLVHTNEEIGTGPPASPPPPSGTMSQEFADETNCAVHGDCICDTEADPGSPLILKDGKGKYYIPPLDNYMSLYTTGCRYTQQQYNLMAYIILTKRMYLH